MEDDFGESSFYQKFSSIAGTEKHKKGGKLFFIRKPDSASNTDKANKKKGRVFCITRADDVEVKELTNEILKTLRIKPINVAADHLFKFIKENGGYQIINEKFTRYKYLTHNNNKRYKREVRGIVNNSFFQDFHESNLNDKTKSAHNDIHINNRCIDELEIDLPEEDLEMQSDDVVFFQKLKINLKSLTNNGIYLDSDSEWDN